MKTLRLSLITFLLPTLSFAQSNWTDLALQNAQADFSSDEQIEFFQLAGQNLGLFKPALQTLTSFAQTQNLQIQQTYRSQTVTPADKGAFDLKVTSQQCAGIQNSQQVISKYENSNDVLAKPFLLYADVPWAQPNSSTFSTFDGMLEQVLGVLSKVNFPEPYDSNDSSKIRVENALRKMHIQQFVAFAQSVLNAKQTLINASNQGCVTLADSTRAQQSLQIAQQTVQLLSTLQNQINATTSEKTISVHPELNHQDRRALSAFFGGYLWRFRGAGGFDNMGTSDRRDIFVTSGFAAILKLNGANASASAISNVLKFGVQMTSWGRHHDMGRLNDDKYSDFVQMEKLGRGMVKATKLTMNSVGMKRSEMITVAGASLGSCYFTAWENIPSSLQVGAQAQNPYMFIFGAPTNFGELCMGTSLGLALSLSALSSN